MFIKMKEIVGNFSQIKIKDNIRIGAHEGEEYDDVMKTKGFNRAMTYIYSDGGWGDALYIKDALL